MNISQKIISLVVSWLFMLVLVPSVYAATTNVSITSTGFLPESITIEAGDTVIWTNNDTTDHTATDDELTWDTDIIAPGETGSQNFITAGTFTYSDTIDPTLTGTIIIQASTAATPTPTPATGGTTPSATPVPQPVSGVSGPTMIMMIMGGLFVLAGVYSFRFN